MVVSVADGVWKGATADGYQWKKLELPPARYQAINSQGQLYLIFRPLRNQSETGTGILRYDLNRKNKVETLLSSRRRPPQNSLDKRSDLALKAVFPRGQKMGIVADTRKGPMTESIVLEPLKEESDWKSIFAWHRSVQTVQSVSLPKPGTLMGMGGRFVGRCWIDQILHFPINESPPVLLAADPRLDPPLTQSLVYIPMSKKPIWKYPELLSKANPERSRRLSIAYNGKKLMVFSADTPLRKGEITNNHFLHVFRHGEADPISIPLRFRLPAGVDLKRSIFQDKAKMMIENPRPITQNGIFVTDDSIFLKSGIRSQESTFGLWRIPFSEIQDFRKKETNEKQK